MFLRSRKLSARGTQLIQDFPRLEEMRQHDPAYIDKLIQVVENCREYADRYARPRALELDRKMGEEHDYFDWDLVQAGLPYRLLSLVIPEGAGGAGGLCVVCSLAMEELCTACAGIAVIFGAHALGISPLVVSGAMGHWEGCLREIVEAESRGEPILMACAVTEPSAGTDVEDPDFLRTARLGTLAKRVKGGYLLNGTKCFISNGSVARYITLCMPTDRERPLESWTSFLIDSRWEGFSVGRVEHKMGQRACHAAELIFEDLLVPDEYVLGNEGDGMQPGTMMMLAVSRPAVGAIATGIARGAYEHFLEWAKERRRGKRPIDQQYIQMELARMKTAIQMSRQVYMDAAMALDFMGLGKLMSNPLMKAMLILPRTLRGSRPWKKYFQSRWGQDTVYALMKVSTTDEVSSFILGYSSLAKAVGADTAMGVSSRCLDLMGTDDSPHRWEMEKCFRDAKLTQIYEGTNQLNRLEVFRGLVLGEKLVAMPEIFKLRRRC